MATSRIGPDDLDWIVERLAARRSALTPHAPVYWRPAPDSEARHREYLQLLLGDGGAIGFRTSTGLILAQPRGPGWLVDDATVADGHWPSDGAQLWEALRPELHGPTRWVCPVPEGSRREFIESQDFVLAESWWHRDVTGELSTIAPDRAVSVDGASARLVSAPPVYSPGGPVLFLTDVRDPALALEEGVIQARSLGSPVVVVSQPPEAGALVGELEAHGFTRHCDFMERLL
jgi:hypothetical protein